MTNKTKSDGDPSRAALERQASAARYDLDRKLDALGERRRRLADLPRRVTQSPWTLVVGLGVVALFGFALAARRRRRATVRARIGDWLEDTFG